MNQNTIKTHKHKLKKGEGIVVMSQLVSASMNSGTKEADTHTEGEEKVKKRTQE